MADNTPFATAQDIAKRRPDLDLDDEQVDTLLELASDLIIEAAGKDQAWADALTTVPLAFRPICIEVVVRVLNNPDGVTSVTETLGAYSHTDRWDAGATAASIGLALTRDEVKRVKRAVGGSSFAAVTLESPYSGTSDDDEPELLL